MNKSMRIVKKAMVTLIFCALTLSFGIYKNTINAQSVAPSAGGIGYTIDETFPDDHLSQAIADAVAGGDVNQILTQTMVDGLQYLSLSFREIDNITGIGTLTGLFELELFGNNITVVPSEVAKLTNLSYLGLGNNQLASLPTEIGQLSKLKNFQVGLNHLQTLPDEIYNLTQLQTLLLEGNELTAVSPLIGQLEDLKVLNLGNNKLASIPKEIGDLVLLEEVILYSNNITDLPIEIGDLSSLVTLDLDDNQLTQLPDSIGQLSLLENLYISTNHLTTLPDSISQLSQLTSLIAGDNQLVSVPEGIGELNQLLSLYLYNNQLTSLPDSIANLTNLYSMLLFGNLLPDNYNVELNNMNFSFIVENEFQQQLTLNDDVLPFTIKTEADLNSINLFDLVGLNGVAGVSSSHVLSFEDENGQAILFSNYIKNGVVQKNATLYVKIRAQGEGIWPNASDRALTVDQVVLNFEVTHFDLLFDLNGGDGVTPDSQHLLEGELMEQPSDPIRTGYAFIGWNTQADSSGITWDFATQTMPANDVTLYAQWEISEHQLQFNLNGGEGSIPSNQTIDYGALATAPTNPIRQGYTFKGWNTVQDGTGILWDFATQTMPANDVTLYAQWEINSGLVTLPKTGQETNAFLIGLLSLLSGSSLLILHGKKKK